MSRAPAKRYTLNQFSTSSIKKDRILFFQGKRGSGKTTGVKEILYLHRDIQMAIVMCGTEESAEQYKAYFPDSFIFGRYDEEVLRAAIKMQRRRLADYKMGRRKKVPYLCILLDDCMFEKPLSTMFMRNVFMNGRHWKLLLIITCQYLVDVPKALRGQIDYALLFKNNNQQERDQLIEIFGGPFPKDKGLTFNHMMNNCTQNYGCMVVDNTADSSRLEDCVFYMRPKERENFQIGSAAMWNYHYRRYDAEKAAMGPPSEDEEDAGGRGKKRKGKKKKAGKAKTDVDDLVVVLKGLGGGSGRQTISNS
jgi:energy-coupling factor transporter ATP-binding protein EcfA2